MSIAVSDTDVKIDVEIIPFEETDDSSVRAHIINPPANVHIWKPGMSSQDVVDTARMLQMELVALCGYKWVPKYNPDKFPVCEKCLKIAGSLLGGE